MNCFSNFDNKTEVSSSNPSQIKKLNILFLPKWYPSYIDPQNGIFIKKHALAVSLFAEVAVLYIQQDPKLKETYSVSFSRQEILELLVYYKQDKSIFRKVINLYRYVRATIMGYRLIREQRFSPDLCHVHIMTRPSLLALYLKKIDKIPFVITEQWTGYASGVYKGWNSIKKSIHRYFLENSSLITAVSNNLRKILSSITSKRIEVVPNIVDSDFQYVPANSSDKVIILTVADLYDKKKNVSDVIKTIGEIYQTNKNIEYHIIGDGEDSEFLKEIASNSIKENDLVHFHGGQPNTYVAEFLRKVDFVVINSNFETFCVIAIEALATGKPVVVTRSGGPEEFVREDFGIVIDKGDRKALKESILEMIRTCRSYDGKKMSSFVKEEFSPESVGKRFFKLYQQVLSE